MWSHSSTKRARFRRPLFAALAVLFVVAATVVVGTRTASWAGPFDLPKGDDPIIGDLGGVPVSVPVNYTHLVTEYDGDPRLFDPERRKWKPPVRTFASKINSLPLMVHLPDFAPRTAENEASYYRAQKSIEGPEEWLPIGVRASSAMYLTNQQLLDGDLFNQKSKIDGLSKFRNRLYERQSETLYGLVEYRSQKLVYYPGGSVMERERLFFFTKDGNNITFIECSANIEPFEESPRNVCTHQFSLYPSLKAEASLQYDARTLSQWMKYEQGVRKLILSFQARSAETSDKLGK